MFISNWLEKAMTSQGYLTTASLKQANEEDHRGHFLSACMSKIRRVHPWNKTQYSDGP